MRRHPAAVAVLAALVLLGAAPALAGGGVRGEPQPELALFTVLPSGSGNGGGAYLPNGNLVMAQPSRNESSIVVCVVHVASRSCHTTATLRAHAGDTFLNAFVVATGTDDVSVVSEDCCNLTIGGGAGGAVVFDSTNGGASWSAEIPGGTIQSVGSVVYVAGQLVVGSSGQDSLNVQAFPVDPSIPSTAMATPRGGFDGVTSLSVTDNGVLVASDDTTNTHVEFAPSGSDFNLSSAYGNVGTVGNALLTAASENAVLTDPGGSLTGGERLQFFNGTKFGPSYRVPDSPKGDDGYFAMEKVGATVHVFFISKRYSDDAFTETSSTGTHWSGLEQFTEGSAIYSQYLVPVLGATGTGVLFETSSLASTVRAQPVLDPQGVHVAFASSHVHVGHVAVLRGTASPRIDHQLVTLERESAGVWYRMSTTREGATGTFVFHVDTPARNEVFRAVVSDKPGYDEYGYSNAATLVSIA